MKAKFLLTICTFFTALGLFAQTPEWTSYQTGIQKNYFRDSTCSTSKQSFEYCQYPFKIKETHFNISSKIKHFLHTKNGDIYIGTLWGLSRFNGTNWTH